MRDAPPRRGWSTAAGTTVTGRPGRATAAPTARAPQDRRVTAAARALALGRAPRYRQETAAPGRAIVSAMRTSPATPRRGELSDAALLARYAAGDQAAARALTARHAPRVFALARRMLGEAAEAEDVTQETMLRLWKIAPDWQADRAALATWLYRVASNLCIDRLRRGAASSARDAVPELADEAPGAASAASRRATGRRRSTRRSPPCPTGSASPSCSATSRTGPTRRSPPSSTPASRRSRACSPAARRDARRALAPREAELGFTDG